MLKQRIITALILAPIAIAGIFFLPPFEFSLFIAAVMTIAAWEWANLAGFIGIHRYVYGLFIAVSLAASTFLPPEMILIPGLLWWCVAFLLVLKYPGLSDYWATKTRISLIGMVCLIPGFTAMVTLKQQTDSSFLILLLFFLIWGADIGAYFSGRALGKNKLAPRVSPGKSWEGLFGGLITASAICVAMLIWLEKPDLSSLRGLIFVACCVFVIFVSVLGDLVISMFKRNRGIKDSSKLLPGHGGVLDRLDSILSAAPVFALIILGFEWD